MPGLLVLGLSLAAPAAGESDPFAFRTRTGTELGLLGAGAGLWGWGMFQHQRAATSRPLIPEEIAALDPTMVNPFDRSATRRWSPRAGRLSNILLYSSTVAPVGLTMTSEGTRQPLTLETMHLETLLINGGATFLLKNLFHRTRPLVFNANPGIPLSLRQSDFARRSFPSGHTSTVFASLVFLATTYGKMNPDSNNRKWVWAGCLTAASTTGYLRYAAGLHYPSDILAGAALGGFVGWLVPQLHDLDVQNSGGHPAAPKMVIGLRLGF